MNSRLEKIIEEFRKESNKIDQQGYLTIYKPDSEMGQDLIQDIFTALNKTNDLNYFENLQKAFQKFKEYHFRRDARLRYHYLFEADESPNTKGISLESMINAYAKKFKDERKQQAQQEHVSFQSSLNKLVDLDLSQALISFISRNIQQLPRKGISFTMPSEVRAKSATKEITKQERDALLLIISGELGSEKEVNPLKNMVTNLATASTNSSSFSIENEAANIRNLPTLAISAINKLDTEEIDRFGSEPKKNYTKIFLAIELADYIQMKEKEIAEEKKSVFFGVKTFFADLVGYAGDSQQKLNAATNMFKVVTGAEKASILSYRDIASLQEDRLGGIIEHYRGTGTLPKDYLKAERSLREQEKNAQDIANRPRP